MLNVDCLCSTYQVCQVRKKERASKKYGLLIPKIAESDIETLGHGLCRSVEFIYNKDTSQKILSACADNNN
jgi:hypothetical protein